MPVLRGLRLLDDAQISPFLEFYLRLLRFWFLDSLQIQATTPPPTVSERGEFFLDLEIAPLRLL